MLFILYIDYRNDTQKANLSDFFLFELKMSCEAMETTHISDAFGSGTANKYTVQWWFKKFYKGDESLDDEKHSGQSRS